MRQNENIYKFSNRIYRDIDYSKDTGKTGIVYIYNEHNTRRTIMEYIELQTGRQCVVVSMYTVAGEHLQTYPSMHQCARETGIDVRKILQCCQGRVRFVNRANPVRFAYGNNMNIGEMRKSKQGLGIGAHNGYNVSCNRTKVTSCYTLRGELIKTYPSQNEAAKDMRACVKGVSMCCIGKRRYTNSKIAGAVRFANGNKENIGEMRECKKMGRPTEQKESKDE